MLSIIEIHFLLETNRHTENVIFWTRIVLKHKDRKNIDIEFYRKQDFHFIS